MKTITINKDFFKDPKFEIEPIGLDGGPFCQCEACQYHKAREKVLMQYLVEKKRV